MTNRTEQQALTGSATDWTNWAGTAQATPRQVLAPRSPDEVVTAVLEAGRTGQRIKMPGSGHSFTEIAVADTILLDPRHLSGIVSVDREALTVKALAGTPLHVLNARLADLGLALHNMGDIDRQTIAGAVSTGTHGTGGVTASLSGQLEALEIVTADGRLQVASRTENTELFQAARVGLGALGILTTLTFRVEPAFTLEAVEQPMLWDEAVGRYDELVNDNHHVDLYWFPHTERCMVKMNNRSLDEPRPLSRARAYVDDELLSNTLFGLINKVCLAAPSLTHQINQVTSRVLSARTYSDASHRVFTAPRRVVFKEMEYSLPREVGMAALNEVRDLIEKSGWEIAFPIEVRCTPPDGAWLSTTHGRDSVYLAFHVARAADHAAYFTGVEKLLRQYDARPHWGKMHTLTAADLEGAYPEWEGFQKVRDAADPERIFSNAYLDRVLG